MAWKWILNGKINPIQDLQRKSSIQKKKAAREMIEFSNIKENLSNETWEEKGQKGWRWKKTKPKKAYGKHGQWAQSRRKNVRMGMGWGIIYRDTNKQKVNDHDHNVQDQTQEPTGLVKETLKVEEIHSTTLRQKIPQAQKKKQTFKHKHIQNPKQTWPGKNLSTAS